MAFTAPNYKLVDPGVYDAVIDNIEEKTAADGRVYALWAFKVVDDYGDTVIVKRPTSLNFGPKSTARKFAEAALGRPIRPGETIEYRDLIGQQLRIIVTRTTDAQGTERNAVSDEAMPAR
jgi:hypothetical protein